MRDVRQDALEELALLAYVAEARLDALRHVIELGGELPDLVARSQADAARQVLLVLGDVAGHADELRERSRQGGREEAPPPTARATTTSEASMIRGTQPTCRSASAVFSAMAVSMSST